MCAVWWPSVETSCKPVFTSDSTTHHHKHQSIFSSSGLHYLCLPRFQRRCPLSPELTPSTDACLSLHTFRCLLKTVPSRLSVAPSGSHKYLRFCLWQTVHTTKDFIYLLTYINHKHVIRSFSLPFGRRTWVYIFWLHYALSPNITDNITRPTYINKQLKLSSHLITFTNCFST